MLVAALGAAVLAGCTTSGAPDPEPSESPTPTAPEDPDAAQLRAWLALEQRYADRYAAAATRVATLKALRSNHTARADAVADHLRVRGLLPPDRVPVPALRGAPASVARTLARAERELAGRYVAALPRVTDPRVVVLGAELAAGARQHAELLALVRMPR